MKDDLNGIEVYDNAFEAEYCEEIIRHFEVMAERQVTFSMDSIRKNQDDRIVFDWAHTQGVYNYDFGLCKHFFERLHHFYTEEYMKKYSMLEQSQQHSAKGMSLQRTSPHKGYHAWHQESANLGSCSRVVTYMLYLNTIEEGGETEFLYQGLRIHPLQGALVFFPTNYLYPHRGNPIYKGYKYIITGWYTWDE